MPITWGQALRIRAEAVGLKKQAELASATGLHYTTISQWFSEERMPSMQPQSSAALARALGLNNTGELERLVEVVVGPHVSAPLPDRIRSSDPIDVVDALIRCGVASDLAVEVARQLSRAPGAKSAIRSTPTTARRTAP